ncbi:unnamed protein product [Soboliphyme baturini]|uniref:Kunitz/Bovine pancreatic trypsin inhibitor domain protein n=1 Tax=Soboliphyme baturini TaxID=241478 RepID=A0A183IWG4_9BILA|nr:unnamed protein product [Soboliphyme baturini]
MTCNQNTDCYNNMYCPAGTCQCIPGYIEHNSFCYRRKDLPDGFCEIDQQCSATWNGATCVAGTCKCPGNEVPLSLPYGTTVCHVPGNELNLTEAADKTLPTNVVRYWFNKAQGRCEPFLFDDNVQHTTANNFNSQEECLSACLPSTPISASIFSAVLKQARARKKHLTGELNSRNLELICAQPKEKGIEVQNVPLVTRYYFDKASQRCESFQYTSFGGNFNNFVSFSECQRTCLGKVCPHGKPLGNTQGSTPCSAGSPCPVGYECIVGKGVCCPTKEVVCTQPKATGACQAQQLRYWYNPQTQNCMPFYYSGCQGNDNNFENLQSCLTFCQGVFPKPVCPQGTALMQSNSYVYCSPGTLSNCPVNYECYFDGQVYGCCPKKEYTCNSHFDAGVFCIAQVQRWWFNPATQMCMPFIYNGCGGNSNRFDSRERCESYCGSLGCPFSQSLSISLPMQKQPCMSGSECANGYECTGTSPKQGSLSRFCCPTFICSMGPEKGKSCTGNQLLVTRYYFDATTRQCTSFLYAGCDGNANNFLTSQECNNFCQAAGEGTTVDPQTHEIAACQSSMAPCRTGFTCRPNPLTGKSICCGSTDMGMSKLKTSCGISNSICTVQNIQRSIL